MTLPYIGRKSSYKLPDKSSNLFEASQSKNTEINLYKQSLSTC